MPDLLDKVKAIENDIIEFRRDLHAHPELSGREFMTQAKIMEQLSNMGIPCSKAGNTSLIAVLKGGKSGRTVALRCDIDALPIEEDSGVEFTSQNPGVMHACGHDAHTAMLIGAARVLSGMKDAIPGEIRFFFQEGEETFSGAKKIIEAGGMDGVDACFGLHGTPNLEAGWANIVPGDRMAGCDTILVTFKGVSGHGSAPYLAKDTIHPACMFVTDLQGIAAKNVDPQLPLVLTVGKMGGGTKVNIIADCTKIEISMRYYDPKVRETAHSAIKRHAKAIADAYEITAEVVIEESAPVLTNDEKLTALAEKAAEKVLGGGKNKPMQRVMGSEGMPFYFRHAKGVYIWLGNGDGKTAYFQHNSKFRLNEDYLKYGAAVYAQFALDYLNGN